MSGAATQGDTGGADGGDHHWPGDDEGHLSLVTSKNSVKVRAEGAGRARALRALTRENGKRGAGATAAAPRTYV